MASRVLLTIALLLAACGPADAAPACPRDEPSIPKSMPGMPVLLQRVSHTRPMDGGNILYMVKSYKGFYETKLRSQLKTWASTVNKASFMVLGDEAWADYPIQIASACASDATEGLACRVAYGFTLAAKHPGNWSWLYVVDDDHYVRPTMVQKVLSKLDSSKPVGAGCYGCGTPQYCDGHGGFCGGCGYAFSRSAVTKMVGQNATEFLQYHDRISRSKKSEGREDMAISCAMRERVPDLQIEQMAGNIGGDVPDDLQDLRRNRREDATLGWHHVTPEQMEALHKALK